MDLILGAAIAVAAATTPPDEWEQTASTLRSALLGSSVKRLEESILLAVKDDSERAAKLVLGQIPKAGLRAYWRLIAGLSRVTTKEAVEPILSLALASKDAALRRDLMMALQLNLTVPAEEALTRILTEGAPDLRLIAMDELVKRRSKKAVTPLIDLLDREGKQDADLRAQAMKALHRLTEADPGPSSAAWRAWWKSRQEEFTGNGEDAPKTAGTTVVESLQRNRLGDYEEIKKGDANDIVVVAGVYDEVQKILEKMSIPHTFVLKADFAKRDLSGTSVLIVNCDDYRDGALRFPRQQVARIRDFVAGGGFLFTSDWGLVEVLEIAFPGYCKKGMTMEEGAVEIYPRKGATGHPLLRDVFVKVNADGGAAADPSAQTREKLDFRWLIDVGTYSVFHDASKVEVLIESPELSALYVQGGVALTFNYGDGRKPAGKSGVASGGRVLHVLSHFIKQKTRNDEFAIQNMLLNFMIEARGRRAPVAPQRK